VEWTIGPYRVSSSRTTTFATNAAMMNTAKMPIVCSVTATANGEFFLMFPATPPMRTLSEAIEPNVSRAKMRVVTQKTGERTW
jgi:hypothetical protein